jgi:DNA-binding beta-propeller fold protein YncE
MRVRRWSWIFTGIVAAVLALVYVAPRVQAGPKSEGTVRVAGTNALLAPISLPMMAMPDVMKDSTPTPYHRVDGFASTLPKGQQWGSVTGVAVNHGHIWIVQRCGQNSCDGTPDDPIVEFDMSGKVINSFGGGLFVSPHGLTFDKAGDFYVADYQGNKANTKGRVVYKFNQDGKILMTLGTPGVAGSGPNQFSEPNEVAIAPDGDLFIVDGHSIRPDSAARVVKLSPDGKFIKAWGKVGDGPSEFKLPHTLRFDGEGRLWVADRDNNRLQVFDQDGKYIAEYKQFGRPVGLDIEGDTIIVADSESTAMSNPGYTRGRGITIANWKTLKVTAFIPLEGDDGKPGTSGPEDVYMTGGAVYAGFITQKQFVKYAK